MALEAGADGVANGTEATQLEAEAEAAHLADLQSTIMYAREAIQAAKDPDDGIRALIGDHRELGGTSTEREELRERGKRKQPAARRVDHHAAREHALALPRGQQLELGR